MKEKNGGNYHRPLPYTEPIQNKTGYKIRPSLTTSKEGLKGFNILK
jgi:hypothetical protein